MKRNKKMNQENCYDCATRSSGVFCEANEEVYEGMDKQKIVNLYKKGQTLFVEGNPTHGLYCIKDGSVKITKLGVEGKETMVRLVTKGDMLGHRSVFSCDYYGATATAVEDTTVCFFDKNFMIDLVKKDPSIALNLIKNLSRDLGLSEEKQSSYSQRNVFERVCELIIILQKSHGETLDDGTIKINLKLTREEMASYLGIATETFIRCVSDLKKENLITQSGRYIVILDKERIVDLANID